MATCRGDPACLVSQTYQRAKAARHRPAKATVDDVVPACPLTAAHETPRNGVTWCLPTAPREPTVQRQTAVPAELASLAKRAACQSCSAVAQQGSNGQRRARRYGLLAACRMPN